MTEPRPIAFWLKLVDGLLDERMTELLEEHGLTRRQWQLMTVLMNGPSTIDDLEERVRPLRQLDHGGETTDAGSGRTAADHLSELVESKWIEVSTERYALTDRGRIAYENLTVRVSGLQADLAGAVSPEEHKVLADLLGRMAQHLGWQGD